MIASPHHVSAIAIACAALALAAVVVATTRPRHAVALATCAIALLAGERALGSLVGASLDFLSARDAAPMIARTEER